MNEKKRINWTLYLPSRIEIPPEALTTDGKIAITHLAKVIRPRGYLYVFGARDLVKIGKTDFSVYRRWHSVRTANPWLEPPLYVSPPLMEQVSEAERECHAELRSYRVSGEWFSCERSLAINTVIGVIHARSTCTYSSPEV